MSSIVNRYVCSDTSWANRVKMSGDGIVYSGAMRRGRWEYVCMSIKTGAGSMLMVRLCDSYPWAASRLGRTVL